jgi:hypothetical protein
VRFALPFDDALGRGIQVSDKERDQAITADQPRRGSRAKTSSRAISGRGERAWQNTGNGCRRDLAIEKLVATHIAPDTILSPSKIASPSVKSH